MNSYRLKPSEVHLIKVGRTKIGASNIIKGQNKAKIIISSN